MSSHAGRQPYCGREDQAPSLMLSVELGPKRTLWGQVEIFRQGFTDPWTSDACEVAVVVRGRVGFR